MHINHSGHRKHVMAFFKPILELSITYYISDTSIAIGVSTTTPHGGSSGISCLEVAKEKLTGKL